MRQISIPSPTQTQIKHISVGEVTAPLTITNHDPSLLHPSVRASIEEVLRQLNAEGIEFAMFEGYRSPERQMYLYAQGRTRPGKIITRAKAFESYHQYGLGADIVLKIDGQWSWGGESDWWHRLHEVGEFYGLEHLDFEQPHLQMTGLSLDDLKAGLLPGGGDASWWENIEQHKRNSVQQAVDNH